MTSGSLGDIEKVSNIDGEDEASATVIAKPPPDPLVQRGNSEGGGGGGCFIIQIMPDFLE